MIHRLQIPVDLDGDEIGSLVKTAEGTTLSCVDVSETSPVTWGILLVDMLRQAAKSFERRGLTIDGRLMAQAEIERDIKRVFDNEYASPSSDIEQLRDLKKEN